jgi:hypothetical protein
MFMDKKEERKDLVEATDSDRRDFLKTAVAAAGALAVAAAIGDLASDEAEASEPFVGRQVNTKQFGALKASPVRGTELQMLKGEGQKSLRLEGSRLGNVLKNEGLFMGPDIKDISKVASTLSLSY